MRYILLTILCVSMYANTSSNDKNTTKSYDQYEKEKNQETKKAIDDFMKKYKKVLGGC